MLPLSPGLWVPTAQLLPTLPPAALTRVIMSLEQKSQHCKPEEGVEAQEEALGLVGAQAPATEEQEAAASSSSPLVPGTLEEVPAAGSTGPPQSPQGASALPSTVNFTCWRQPNEGSSSQEEEGPSTSPDPESLFREALSKKVDELVHFLLLKYRAKELVTKAEMLERVIKNYKHCFPVIFGKASESLKMIFGIDVKEVDPTSNTYTLVTCLGLSYDGLLGGNHIFPKTGLLIIVLGTIAMEGDSASEEEIWEELSVMDVYDGREHSVYGEPRKLLTQEWVQENYLEYRKVPGSDPARYEFLWGPRALAETSYVKVLEHVVRVNARVRISYPSLREAALREEEEGV
uniref:MAGE family member A4 n=2 Tax=Macaca fascicularis TaxID=9541 RepID=A0A7N9CNF2_MACFA